MCDDSEGTIYMCLVTPLTACPVGATLILSIRVKNQGCLGTDSGPSAQAILEDLLPSWSLRGQKPSASRQ